MPLAGLANSALRGPVSVTLAGTPLGVWMVTVTWPAAAPARVAEATLRAPDDATIAVLITRNSTARKLMRRRTT